MKALLLSLSIVLFGLSSSAFAGDLFIPKLNSDNLFSVSEVAYDNELDSLLVNLEYSGGCYEHEFDLDVVDCYDGICKAKVAQLSGFDDFCKRMVREIVVFPMNEYFDEVSEVVIGRHSVKID